MRVWVAVFAKYTGISRERAKEVISDWILENKDSPPNLVPFDDNNFEWLCVLVDNFPKATLISRKGQHLYPESLRNVSLPHERTIATIVNYSLSAKAFN
jgi:hypothetical protein